MFAASQEREPQFNLQPLKNSAVQQTLSQNDQPTKQAREDRASGTARAFAANDF
jgi:hypothetical protein